MARIYTKFKTVRSRARLRQVTYWSLGILGAVVLGWLTWPNGKPPPTFVASSERVSLVKTNLALTPAVRTNWVAVASTNALVRLARTNLPVPTPRPSGNVPTNVVVPALVPPAPPVAPLNRGAQNVLEAQVGLAAHGISAGSLDGVLGSQTRGALRAFQAREHLPATGELDDATKSLLVLPNPPHVNYLISSNDLARLRPLAATWLGKSQQERLDYETILELVAEKGHAHPDLVRRLNPEINWTNVVAGSAAKIPAAEYRAGKSKAAFVRIRLLDRTLEAFDAKTNLLAHFPCSIARRIEKRPVGQLRVTVIAHGPNYKFDPQNFPGSAEARSLKRPLMLPAGPNNPVGTAWIGLDKPGYGIHGTPRPEDVGRTESHGCFRLANWNAEFLARLVSIGTPVYVEP